MNIGSWCTLLVAVGSGALIAACSSNSASTTSNDGGSSGGTSAAGGKAGSAGGTVAASGGGGGVEGKGSGGAGGQGGRGGAGLADAGRGDGGATGTGGKDVGAGGSQVGDAGDGGLACAFPRCRPPYPAVPFSTANPYADDKAMLGKILFWEEQMGQLDTMACGTCHRGASGGSDPRTNSAVAMLAGPDGIHQTQPDILSDDLRVAQGVPACNVDGSLKGGTTPQTTSRKPPSYLDAMFASQIFWDGRAGYCKNNEGPSGGCFYDPDVPATALIVGAPDLKTGFVVGGALEAQASGPPANSAEMACDGRTWAAIETKLTNVTPLAKAKAGTIPTDMKTFIGGRNYPAMFQAVYGNDPKYKVHPTTDPDNIVNARRIVFAIATHERRLTSNETPWDLWNDGTAEHASAMTASQIAGFTLFMGKARCSTCHAPPLFTDNAFHNIGFHEPSWDAGRQAITNVANSADLGKFKTATLRNVGLREPFGLLHDGDGPGHSLDTILELYNTGGKRSDATILPLIDPVMTGPLGLTTPEINEILDFLRNALTDPRVKAEAFPFDRPKLGTE